MSPVDRPAQPHALRRPGRRAGRSARWPAPRRRPRGRTGPAARTSGVSLQRTQGLGVRPWRVGADEVVDHRRGRTPRSRRARSGESPARRRWPGRRRCRAGCSSGRRCWPRCPRRRTASGSRPPPRPRCSHSSAAAVDESTPPDMATTMRGRGMRHRDMRARTLRRRPHPGNHGGHQRRGAVDLGSSVLPAPRLKRTASRACVGRQPQRQQHRRRRQRARAAGRAAGHRHPLEVEPDHHQLPGGALEADVAGARAPGRRRRRAGGRPGWPAAAPPAGRAAGPRCAARSASSCRARRQASPKPTMPGTFSVPARRSRSWCPPASSGAGIEPAPHPDRPHALGAAQLVRRQRQRVDPQRPHVDGHAAQPPGRRRCEPARPRGRGRAAASAATGYRLPSSWLTSARVTSAASARTTSASASGSMRPSASAGDPRGGTVRRARPPPAQPPPARPCTAGCSSRLEHPLAPAAARRPARGWPGGRPRCRPR